MKLLLIDLDDTLVDTKSFKADLFSKLSVLTGITSDEIQENYKKVLHAGRLVSWSDQFVEAVSQVTGTSVEKIHTILMDSLKSIRLNENAYNYFLKFDGFKTIFSYGQEAIQKIKIKAVGLDSHADNIIITQKPKPETLESLIKENQIIIDGKTFEDVTLVDNHQFILDEVSKKFPWIKCINVTEL